MQTSQPATSPLGIVLLGAAIYLVIKSRKRLQTISWMVGGFLATLLLFLIPGALLRIGDPVAQGRIAGLVGLLVAVIVGWWHLRTMGRTNKETSAQPTSKD